jgi:16S rRNA (guanine527-N7)-methyltransferase
VGSTDRDDLVGKVEAYLQLLWQWNARINLTAIRDLDATVDKHIVDSLAVLPWLPAGPGRLVDVGSGPGLPGLVLAMVRADLEATLVESNQKKCAFLEAAKRALRLGHVRVAAVRAEQVTASPGFRPFDIAISRATLDLPDWLELGSSLVRPGGIVIGMEGAERHALPAGAERHVYEVANAERAVVVFHVEHSTPPRSAE